MTSRRRLAAGLLGAMLTLSVVPLTATPAAAVSAPTVVAEGLNGPNKLTFGPDGDLYVAESGIGGSENCLTEQDPESGEEQVTCYGETGSVTEIDLDGETQTRVVEGLPSVGGDDGASGPVDVAFGPAMHVITGFGGGQEKYEHFADDRIGAVLRVVGPAVTVVSNLIEFEIANDPDAVYDEGQPEGAPPASEGIDSNPFGLTFDGVDVLAVDAGGNDVLRVAPDGTTTLEALLPLAMTPAPPFLGLPPGTQMPYQPVPTSIDMDGDTPLVGNLTGFPFPVGAAKVWDVSGEEPTPVHEGLTNIIDIDVAPDGNVYVLEFADNGLLSDDPAPALVQIREDGTRKYLAYGQAQLPAPGGVEVGPDGKVYVSVCSLCGEGAGMVWELDPSVASDPATAAACDPTDVPGTTFPDIKDSVHREAIECMAFWGAINGFGDGTFRPGADITRAQAASMLVRALETAGFEFDADPPDAFTDDSAPHEENIDKLAAAGIVRGFPAGTYQPNQQITRDQLTALFARAWDVVAGGELAAGEDAFTDDEGNVHEDDINAVAAMGWVKGKAAGIFAPRDEATRGQFATMLARMLSTLVEEGGATPPEA
jgi:hypothetical protein